MIKLFGDLLGLPLTDKRKRKADPLGDKSLLTSRKITLLFPVATSFGVKRLEDFLKENGLPDVEVARCHPGFLEVLTAEGQEALENGNFLDVGVRNCPANPDSHFVRIAFEKQSVWKTQERKTRALAFCKEIGLQLFRQYLDQVGYEWEETKIQRCALGMFGMGLAFGFAHSIPKATLPLFWASGEVHFQGKRIRWAPLFPCA